MDCKGLTHDLLLDHVEGLCEQPLREPIDRHLQDCASCRERRHEVERIAAGVRTLLLAPPQKALVDQLDAAVLGGLDKLAPLAKAKPNRMPLWVGGIAAAAAAALVAVALSWGGSGGAPSERTQPPIAQAPSTEPVTRPEPDRVAAPPSQPGRRPIEEPHNPAGPSTEPSPTPAPTPKADNTQPPAPAPSPAPPAPPPPPPDTSPRSRMPSSEPANPGPVPAPEPKRDPPPEPAFARGDINGDRVIDVRDVEHLDSDIREGRTPDLGRADLTGDGRVDCGDVLALLRALERHP
jgi:dockerin type I repeat protein